MTTDTLTRTPADATPGAGADTRWHTYQATDRDRDLRNELMVHHLPLVKIVAGRVRATLPAHHDLGDLISDGIFGLLDAIEKFDPDRGVQFQTYASQRIKGAILDALRTNDWVPRTVRDRKKTLDTATASAAHRLGRTPTHAEIAAEAGISTADLHHIRRRPQLTIGLTDADLDILNDADRPGPVDATTRIMLRDAIRALTERDQQVIVLSYFDGLTLAEIGTILGVSEARVGQLRTRALKALRNALDTP